MNKSQLLAKCADLGIDTESLDTNAKLRDAIQAKEAELSAQAEAEQAAAEKAEAERVAAEKAAAEKAEAEKAEAERVAAEKAAAEKAEAEKAEAERVAAEKAAAEKAAEKLVYEDERGRKWTFKESAPKKINIDGHPMTQEEIFADEEVIADLVYGNSSFLTQTY